MAALVDDLRHGLRSLVRWPGFTLAATLFLGLGAGVTAAVFSLVDAYLLRPLPYANAERIVVISEGRPTSSVKQALAPDHLFLIEAEARSFDLVATYVAKQTIGFDLSRGGDSGGGRPERIQGGAASPSFFEILGVKAALGRTFTEQDETGADPVVILSHRLWRRRFGGDPGVIGRRIDVSGTPRAIVGVLSAGFGFPEVELWVPRPLYVFQALGYPITATFYPRVLAHLKEGVSLAQARDELHRLSRGIADIDGFAYKKGMVFHAVPLREALLGDLKPLLWMLFGSVALVLLITCTNLSNLMLGRLILRQPELAMRSVLGASRGRVARQLILECLCLGLAAGTVGLLAGRLTLQVLLPFSAPLLPTDATPQIDLRVLGFLFGVSAVCGVLAGLAPILHRSRPDERQRLAEAAAGASRFRGRKLWGLLVVAQLALSFMLLAGEGLVLRSFQALSERRLGFDPRNVLTFDVFLRKHEYASNPERFRFLQETMERLSRIPGVLSVASSDGLPIQGGGSQQFVITREEQLREDLADLPMTDSWAVSSSFFRTMGIGIRKGRVFTPQDGVTSQPVVIVDERLAERTWPGAPALGKRIRINGVWREVVGIAGRVENQEPGLEPATLIYIPLVQEALPRPSYHLALRSAGDPLRLVPAVTAAVQEVNPDQTLYGVTTMASRLAESSSRERLVSLALGLFALLGLILALSGLFAVVRFATMQRRREIGIRMALGASQTDVLKLILRDGSRLIVAGLALGMGAAAFSSQALSHLLYGVTPGDLVTFVGVAVALAVAALAAVLLPGLEALRSDPLRTIRSE
ncbi:MAG: putative transport system permease protein [Acidobacteriota bacterium]|jgi:predicted permease|nr:putative transport system permease protein [Acidobacteriota bacterium]